jgi:predicted phage-related endonuclease
LMSEEEWIEARKTGLGGTDTATLMVQNKWSTPLKVYQSKFEDSRPLTNISPRRGKALEPLVCDLYAEKTGYLVFDVGHRLFKHPYYDFIFGTPDRLVWNPIGKLGILEGKTAVGQNCQMFEYGVPKVYEIQAQKYWMILDVILDKLGIEVETFCDVSALLDDNHSIYPLTFNPALRSAIFEADHKFWNEHYIPRIPPSINEYDDIRDVYSKALTGSEIQADEELLDLIKHRQILSWGKDKELEKEQKRIEDQIIALIGENESVIYQGQPLMTYKQTASSIDIDTKKLLEKYPEVYSDVYYQKEGSRRLNFKDKIIKTLC